MAYMDKTLNCRDCGRDFVFTAGEQEFFAQRGFENEPSRCPECRRARKASIGRGVGGPRQLFEATCSACGKVAMVPFQPSGDKPVYCSECFAIQRGENNY